MAVAVVTVAGLLGACDSGTSATTGTGPTTRSTSRSSTTSATGQQVVPIGAMAVGVHTDTYVDVSRSTPANGAVVAPTRTMATTIWYPAPGAGAGAPVPDAAPDRAHGPYPVVVFAHGFAVVPRTYGELLSRWASAGYVVVAPALPLLNRDAPGGASHDDYPTANLADVQFVIGEVLRRAGVATDVLSGLIDPRRIGVAGHSDGELLAYLLGFGGCCRDLRIRSVVAMAGDLGNVNLLPEATGVPLLHVISGSDEFDPTAEAVAFDRANLHVPASWIVLRDAPHLAPFSDAGDPRFGLVVQVTVDFLDGTLKSAGGTSRLQADVAAAGAAATIEIATRN